jgi:4-hydroxy-tetrahydrodipicolinate synthase
MFNGLITALITPFANNSVDYESYENLISRQVKEKIGILIFGTTGESPTLSREEKVKLLGIAVNKTKDKVPLIVGTGNNCTATTIEFTNEIETLGADAALVVVPYYNKPTQQGLYQHFKEIHNNTNIPIIIYNIPGRTSVNMEIDTVIHLAELDRIVGIKDSPDKLSRVSLIRKNTKKEFSILCADDEIAVGFNAHGGSGCFSVASNILPKACKKLHNLLLESNYLESQKLNMQLLPLYEVLFCETNPAPIKYAASKLGLCFDDVRLPLVTLSEESKKKIDNTLQRIADLINL